jgi:hypothetical protein
VRRAVDQHKSALAGGNIDTRLHVVGRDPAYRWQIAFCAADTRPMPGRALGVGIQQRSLATTAQAGCQVDCQRGFSRSTLLVRNGNPQGGHGAS